MSIKYPPNPSVLDRFVQLLKLIHKNWRAKRIVLALTPQQRLVVRRKIYASGIFKGDGAIQGGRVKGQWGWAGVGGSGEKGRKGRGGLLGGGGECRVATPVATSPPRVGPRYRHETDTRSLPVCGCFANSGKKPYEINKKVEGDYVSQDAMLAPAFAAQRSAFLGLTRDSEVVFSAFVTKVNRNGSGTPRALVLSENNLYKLDAKSFKIHKTPVPIKDIKSISLTTKKDTTVVLHLEGGFDLVLDLGTGPGGDKVGCTLVHPHPPTTQAHDTQARPARTPRLPRPTRIT